MKAPWHKRVAAIAGGLLTAASAIAQPAASSAPTTMDDFTGMSIEDLLNVDVHGVAGLTATDSRRSPVNITYLDERDIQQSGARDLNHLLEIYVPNLQLIHHHSHQDHLGFRGIISDRDDKYLFQVNGLTLNNRMLVGADNERGIPLLGDMRSVSVVRGPASATHGSGAVAGVIDVETFNGLTFQGSDIKLRQGFVDEYSAMELRYGRSFNETSGLFFYLGIADVQGTDSDYFIGKSYPAANGLPANVAGEPYGGPMSNVGDSGFDTPRLKAHISYVNGPIEFWARYTQDGNEMRPIRQIYTTPKPANVPVDDWTRGRQAEDQQFTAAVRLKKALSSTFELELQQSFDNFSFTDSRAGISQGVPIRHAHENQLFSRAVGVWTPNDSQSLAFGTEFSHIWYYDPAQSDALDRVPVVLDRDWETNTVSFFVEEQWKINDQLTLFLSFRTEKNDFSDWLMSPRCTLVYMPTEWDTFKVMIGQSVRRGDDEELYGEYERSGTIPDPETLRSYELSYDRKLTEEWNAGIRGFYQDYDAIGWIPALYQSASLGQYQIVGGELQVTYRTRKTRVTMSESVSTLVHGSVPDGAAPAGQGISSSPYGFGNELANWAPSITKLAITHDINSKWTVSSSVIYYSGFPGGEDYSDYASSLATTPQAVPLSDPGYDTPYGPNLFVNMGVEYRPTEHCTVRLDGYNLAALFDQSISKRNYILRTSEYSEEPAAVAVSVSYSF